MELVGYCYRSLRRRLDGGLVTRLSDTGDEVWGDR